MANSLSFLEMIKDKFSGLFGGGTNRWFSSSFFNKILGMKGAVWMPVNKPGEIYRTIPQIQSVIDRKAKLFSNMEIKIMKGDEEVVDAELAALLENPNILEGMNDWLESYKVQEQVYGNQFMYKNKPSNLTKYPASLINISAAYLRPITTGKWFDQIDMLGIVEKYEYLDDGGNRKFFETPTILHSRIKDLDNPIVGCPPIMSLRFPITNTKLAYEYYNVISGEKGAIGILSNASKDSMGSVPLTPKEQQKVEESTVNTYGVQDGKRRVHVTSASLNWQPMSYPTKDLELSGQIDANFMTIVDHFGLNINMFSNKSATFENVKNAIIQTYQDTIFPEADRFMQRLTKFLMLPKGIRLVASYDHIAILQDDKQKEAQTITTQIAAITQLLDKELIDKQTASDLIAQLTHLELGKVPEAVVPPTNIPPVVPAIV